MIQSEIIAINVFGVLVSIFSIFVTIRIYQKYRLRTSLFFIVTSCAVFIWNILHLSFNLIGENTLDFWIIRVLWLLLVYSGIIFVYSFVYGYSNLRYENLNWRLIVYASLASIFAVLFAVKPDWVTVSFDSKEGWVTTVHYNTFWTLFAISILIVDFLEIIIPLVNTYANANRNRNPLMVMLIGILLAIFSNALEPILQELSLPQAIRFLVADIGFLIFFIILLKYPFSGLYDSSIINQVIVADTNGVPKLTLAADHERAILASGAIIGVNSVLEEITATHIEENRPDEEITRKIELGNHQFFIIIRGSVITAFQFQNPTGVCYSKFKSLARIFAEEPDEKTTEQQKLDTFERRMKEYFTDFVLVRESETSE